MACERCLRASALRNEALRYAEKRSLRPADARELLQLEPEEQARKLESIDPHIAEAIDRQMEAVLGGREVWSVCSHEPQYPDGLRRLVDPPPAIFGIGRVDRFRELQAAEGVAVVGARHASAYGREVAYSIANDASSAGLAVVSGMALGVDGAAHRGALQGGGRTVAVLAGGPEAAYPRSHRLLHEQIADAGCVISETPPGNEAKRWAFPARNRIIAAMSSVTVFVEGTAQSGARHTMDFAAEIGSVLAAVPGPVTSPLSEGPNAWLREPDVLLIRSFADIAEQLKLEVFEPQLPGFEPRPDGLLGYILDLIAAGQKTPRAIAGCLMDRERRDVMRALGELELRGMIVRDGTGEYRLSQ